MNDGKENTMKIESAMTKKKVTINTHDKIVLYLLVRYNEYPMSRSVLRFVNISKQFNSLRILSKINLSIYQGETVGITGPIGAGKSSLIYTALGLIKPDSGYISFFSYPFDTHRQKILQQINFASSYLRLNGYSSVKENLLTFARLYQINNSLEKIETLAKTFDILYLLSSNRKVYKLSSGENIKVNLCKAFLNNPKILFLDEITAHLDTRSISILHHYISKQKAINNMTVVTVSQRINELKKVCDRIVYMKHGSVYE
jgi:ABC-2 type transport system ATP-binding protein